MGCGINDIDIRIFGCQFPNTDIAFRGHFIVRMQVLAITRYTGGQHIGAQGVVRQGLVVLSWGKQFVCSEDSVCSMVSNFLKKSLIIRKRIAVFRHLAAPTHRQKHFWISRQMLFCVLINGAAGSIFFEHSGWVAFYIGATVGRNHSCGPFFFFTHAIEECFVLVGVRVAQNQ